MIRLDNNKRTAQAIERCRRVHPKVVHAGDNYFCVTGSNGVDRYYVQIAQPNGMTLAACDCQAGRAGQLCFHAVAAATVAPLYAAELQPKQPATQAAPVKGVLSTWAAREAERQRAVLVKQRPSGPTYNGVDI